MDKFLSHKRTFDDNKASTSAQTSIVPKIKSRKYSQEYLNFGFTITEVNGEEKPLCVICSKILAADSMKPNKLKRHFETLHAIEIVETMFGDNFAKELQSIPLSNDTVSRRIDDIAEDVEQQLFANSLRKSGYDACRVLHHGRFISSSSIVGNYKIISNKDPEMDAKSLIDRTARHVFLNELIRGLGLTLAHIFKEPATINYPFEKVL
ncbi:NADH dehydrogenase iron-sulfur protein 8, mitochondrial [Trichonephila clavipes]|nr:NADH dehydrogenase iron-sulfur protein 8, mitochondrial [Trichonephila clavipes]